MSLHHGLRSAAGASVADPYFASTSLLLLGNGTNGGQNNTFVDGSSNAFSVTRYGNTTQGTFSPFGYNWSNYFDGSGDYLSLSASAISGVGSSNFSIECWVFATRQTNTYAQGLVSYGIAGSVTGTSFLSFQLSASGYLAVAYATGSSLTLTDATLFPINQWVHAVVCRSGSTLSLFVNGTRVATATTSATVGNSGDTLFVGGQWYDTTAGRQLQGYIANARIVNGSSAYDATQSSLTVPTAPLTAITNTSLLTCQSNRFLDNSSNAFAITPYGNAAVTNFAPFPTNSEYSAGVNGGSGYFDGTGDYLSASSNAAFSFGTGNFTIECFFYPTSSDSTQTLYLLDSTGGITFGFETVSSVASFLIGRRGTAVDLSATYSIVPFQWLHLVAVRSGTTASLYINGTRVATGTNSLNYTVDGPVNVGAIATAGGFEANGYISNLRVVKGTAVYDPTQTTLTVPTSPLASITNTSLLLSFTNAAIIDSTGKNDLETVGDAQISTSTKKYGTGSLKFDGTGDYLLIPNNQSFNFGSSDWTIEAWIYPTTISVDQEIYAKNEGSYPGGYEAVFLITSGNKLQFASYGSSFFYAQSTGSISANVWTHVVAVRNGSTITLYINGTADGTTTPQTIQTTTSRPTVGRDLESSGGGRYFTGYIDDLRITKGVARYTANFTPPTRQLPAR